MTSRRADVAATPEQEALVDRAREAVSAREARLDQEGLVADAPEELGDHIEQLRGYAPAAELFAQGWRVAVVDIARVRAAQPIVHVDHAEERTAPASEADIGSVAAITLPIPSPTELPGGFDAAQKAWVLTSANPNLRISGAWSGQVNGQAGFGFHVALLPSFVRVANFQSGFILVDGYHRSSDFTTLHGNVTITGVGFWDILHGQTGVAPNGIELHPVLSLTGTCTQG